MGWLKDKIDSYIDSRFESERAAYESKIEAINDILRSKRLLEASLSGNTETALLYNNISSNQIYSHANRHAKLEARTLYYTNPISKRLVKIIGDYVYGTKPVATAKTSKLVAQVIDEFWNDPINNLDKQIVNYSEMLLGLDGELLLRARVNPQTGKVRLSYIDSLELNKVYVDSLNNSVVTKVELFGKEGKEGEVLDVIRYREGVDKVSIGSKELGNLEEREVDGFRVGDVFYFRQEYLITGRGRPPYEHQFGWMKAHDNTFYDEFKNVSAQSSHIWDVTLTGATEEELLKRKAEIGMVKKPSPGSIMVHNESETWEAKSPNINPNITKDLLVQVRKLIGLGSGLSETWVAASDDVNRNTAEVADTPPYKHLGRLQWEIKHMIRDMVDYAIDQAIMHGYIPNVTAEERSFDISMPDMTATDNDKISNSLMKLVQALIMGKELGLTDSITDRRLFYQMAHIDEPDGLEDRVKNEQKARDQQDYLKLYRSGLGGVDDKKAQNLNSKSDI